MLPQEKEHPYPFYRCHGLFCSHKNICQRYLCVDNSQPFIDPPIVNRNGYCENLIGHKIDYPKHLARNSHFQDMWLEGFFHMWKLSWTEDEEKLYGKISKKNL